MLRKTLAVSIPCGLAALGLLACGSRGPLEDGTGGVENIILDGGLLGEGAALDGAPKADSGTCAATLPMCPDSTPRSTILKCLQAGFPAAVWPRAASQRGRPAAAFRAGVSPAVRAAAASSAAERRAAFQVAGSEGASSAAPPAAASSAVAVQGVPRAAGSSGAAPVA